MRQALLILVLVAATAWAGPDNLNKGTPTATSGGPTVTQVINRKGYALGYCEDHEQPAWVIYKFTRNEAKQKIVPRLSKYKADPEITTGSAKLKDYRNSGYDTGHMATANHMRWDTVVQRECAYYSNMCPQLHALNNGVWKTLEAQVEEWATDLRSIWVTTGPVLQTELPKLPNSRVSIPSTFYKVILYSWGNQVSAVGFVMTQDAVSQPLESYAIPVDSVETLTGLDFFNGLRDDLENQAEGEVDSDFWFY